MRSNLLQLITRNWPIKGAALFLALMLDELRRNAERAAAAGTRARA